MKRSVLLTLLMFVPFVLSTTAVAQPDYRPVVLSEQMSPYAAKTLYEHSSATFGSSANRSSDRYSKHQGVSSSFPQTISSYSIASAPRFSFSSTSSYIGARGADSFVTADDMLAGGSQRVSPERPPLEPFPDPVGDIPFFWLAGLAGLYVICRRIHRKQAKSSVI